MLYRRREPYLGLAHAHTHSPRREAFEQCVGDRGSDRLEQHELPFAGNFPDERDHLAVVDGLLELVLGRLGQLELDVVEERLLLLALLRLGAVAAADLEPAQLHDDGHPSAAAAAVRASTCSRTSWTRRIVAPRS